LTWDDRDCEVRINRVEKDTYQVSRVRDRRARRVKIGRPDRSLTAVSGMAAVAVLVDRLAIVGALDVGVGPFKRRDRGLSAGELLVAQACAQLAGEDHLVGLDRQRADVAGQRLAAVPAPPSTTAAGLAQRFTREHLAGIEAGIAAVNARVLGLVPQVRRSALDKQITLDFDTTDIEVYGSRKQGVAYNYQGQRCGRAHIGFWAELGVPIVADLGDGRADPRSSAAALLRRALAAVPAGTEAAADPPAEHVPRVRVRMDAGYFASEIALECLFQGVGFAIGAKRIGPVWREVALIGEDAWVPAIGMDDTEVAVMPYVPAWWPAQTVCIARRTRIPVEKISADGRARRKRTIPKDQLTLALDGQAGQVYGYSFVLTNLDVSTPEKIAEVEHWYRHRTDIEALNKDAKIGAALRHLPSGDPAINTVWMWSALLAAAMSAWLQELAGLDRGNGRGRRTIARLRRELINVPARVLSHARGIELRLPPGPHLLPDALDRLRTLPRPG
jgi:Transposase DDE domain group 1